MAESDRRKWDGKYRREARLPHSLRPPVPVLERFAAEGRGGTALDLACGTGRNALWLARHGWNVTAADISGVALGILAKTAKRQGVSEKIEILRTDLEDWSPSSPYDLVLMVNYLDRSLIRRLLPAIRPGGLFILDTFVKNPAAVREFSREDFLLRPGETSRFPGKEFEILLHESYEKNGGREETVPKETLVARKIR